MPAHVVAACLDGAGEAREEKSATDRMVSAPVTQIRGYSSTSASGDKALDEALAKGWTVVDMKSDWKTIFPAAKAAP
jgi:hypothetical protein